MRENVHRPATKRKKIGHIWLALLLLCALLVITGCSGNAKEPPSEPDPAEETDPSALLETENSTKAEMPSVEVPGETEDPAREEGPGETSDTKVPPTEAPPKTSAPAAVNTASSAVFTKEGLDKLVQQAIDRIITPDMTQLEQAKAVWDFTKGGISYTGSSDKSDWQTGAYEGLRTRRGDCFTYYAVSRALLTALGIDNLEVQRVGGPTSHYWNLVNCGDGWYHFDATPRSSKMPYFVSFMFTDAEAADYTARAGRNYYTFDGSLYPERAGGTAEETEQPAPAGDPAPESPEETPPADTDSEPAPPENTDSGFFLLGDGGASADTGN